MFAYTRGILKAQFKALRSTKVPFVKEMDKDRKPHFLVQQWSTVELFLKILFEALFLAT